MPGKTDMAVAGGRRSLVRSFTFAAALLFLAAGHIPRAAAAEPAGLPQPNRVATAVEAALDGEAPPIVQVKISDSQGNAVTSLIGKPPPDGSTAAPSSQSFAYRSITKSFVGTVVLQLAQEGALDLDAPVSAYLEGVPNGEAVTLRHLAAMRSGLPDYSNSPRLIEALLAAPEREPEVGELLDYAFAQDVDFPAGSAYAYSNTNTLLLGEIVEAVTGDSWQATLQKRIGEPLGLASVRYGFGHSGASAGGFQLEDDGSLEELPSVAPGWFGAAGGLTGTLDDLAAWGRALGSGSLLNRETQQQRLASFGPTADDPTSPKYDHYGFTMGEIGGWIGHTGAGLGYQSLAMFDPESERVVAILLNATGENQDLPAEIFQALLPILKETQ